MSNVWSCRVVGLSNLHMKHTTDDDNDNNKISLRFVISKAVEINVIRFLLHSYMNYNLSSWILFYQFHSFILSKGKSILFPDPLMLIHIRRYFPLTFIWPWWKWILISPENIDDFQHVSPVVMSQYRSRGGENESGFDGKNIRELEKLWYSWISLKGRTTSVAHFTELVIFVFTLKPQTIEL